MQLTERAASAQQRLFTKLRELDPRLLAISEYNQRYLTSKKKNAEGMLGTYGSLLQIALRDSDVPPEETVLVDYGGGSGILSLLAKEMGVGTVIYSDIYDVSCGDVQVLMGALDLQLDHVVCGDVNGVLDHARDHAISIDAVVSYDVLEHIYDVEAHFRALARLPSQRALRLVYASTANIESPWTVRKLEKTHSKVEQEHREKTWGHKERDELRSYFEVRKHMISSHAPELSSLQVEYLARATRGQAQPDIESSVDEYRQRGSLRYRPAHATNTCDPSTGNWCEQLIDQSWLRQAVQATGFDATVLAGVYPVVGPRSKRAAKHVLNAVIRSLGGRGMFMAPYYVLYAERRVHVLPERQGHPAVRAARTSAPSA